ncbi:RecQ family ATP-dependent DNA helicase [Algoriphagus lutimaris]|uniref:RecQ family ATP-dependent DNA helicase n=1 Tax=Algoriphagus lutimaris TaxID=613197 RepID=UPI00196AFB68|nr:ATP-dependent DNA helicase RecQ [Algoriphagus lutimaris]MBN3522129.1 RecQ family ATP-dependent DNA helicase [Algoriphagus lutimaris]
MEKRSKEILHKIFGFEDFRPVQKDVINSVLSQHDTLALLPTGGGKSLCYQIPGLVNEGICLVISPLIALMKDQVDALKAKGVKAAAIFSGMSYREIDTTLDNCIYGDYKFLYVSPERLKVDLFIERFKQMPVNLIAVDEAHCISQWGYDFRPQYLEIGEIRKYHPEVPILALTASATPKVCEDIKDKLLMKNEQEFHQSFARENLSFSVRLVENKFEKGVEVLQRVAGSAIWYVRNRQATHQISNSLLKMGISASPYHAGMTMADRNAVQASWMADKTRVMVSTNAFGMGIDKPNVRVVIHTDLPENIENYYQEAGRAGRDGEKSFAVLVSNEQDFETLMDRAALVYPPIDFIKRVYQCLANYYKLAVGSNMFSSFDFVYHEFAQNYDLGVLETFYALKVLEEEGLISLNESFYAPSRIHFMVDPARLYEVQIAYANLDPVVKVLLRTYGGNLFSEYLSIQETKLAKTLEIREIDVISRLRKLAELEVMDYDQRKDKPQLTFLTPRYDAGKLPLNIKRIEDRRALTLNHAQQIIAYAHQETLCRSQFIQEYFGEHTDRECGICDWCIKNRKSKDLASNEEKLERKVIETIIESGGLSESQLLAKLQLPASKELFSIIRKLEDSGKISSTSSGKYVISNYG